MSEIETSTYIDCNSLDEMMEKSVYYENDKEVKCGEFILSKCYKKWRLKCIFCIVNCYDIRTFIRHIKNHLNDNNDDLPIETDPDLADIKTELFEKIKNFDNEPELSFDEIFSNEIEAFASKTEGSKLAENNVKTKKIINTEMDYMSQQKGDFFEENESIEEKSNSKSIEYNLNQHASEIDVNDYKQIDSIEIDTQIEIGELENQLDTQIEIGELENQLDTIEMGDLDIHIDSDDFNESTFETVDSMSPKKIDKKNTKTRIITSEDEEISDHNTTVSISKDKIYIKPRSIHSYSDIACEVCERYLYLEESVEKHRQYYHNLIDSSLSNETLEINKRIPQSKDETRRLVPRLCKFCKYMAHDIKSRIVHERIHTGEKPYKCDICNREFSSKNYLESHKKNMHSTPEEKTKPKSKIRKTRKKNYKSRRLYSNIVCDVCDRNLYLEESVEKHRQYYHDLIDASLSNETLEINKKIPQSENETHRADARQCKYCEYRSAYLKNRVDHERIHTGEKPYKCDICNRDFSSIKYLESHNRIIHSISNRKSKLNENTDKTKKTYRKRKTGPLYSLVKCEICERNLYSNETVEKHRQYYHDTIDLSQNNETMQKNKRIPNIENEISRKNPLNCKFCEHKFTDFKHRIAHERSHTGEKPYECNVCKRHFICESYLASHQKQHNETKKFYCELCKYPVVSMKELAVHMKSHSEDELIRCSYCPRTFITKEYKRYHERVHTGERPFQCNECGKTFLRRTNLTAHARRHAGIKPYKCTYCEKSFYTNEDLKDHSKVHTGERPHSCKVCLATFPRKKALSQHMKIHSDVRGYVCTICEKSYKQYSALYNHKKTCHDLAKLSSK